MIIYNADGMPLETFIKSKPRHCFLITKLGFPIPKEAEVIKKLIVKICKSKKYEVIDANVKVTGRDFFQRYGN